MRTAYGLICLLLGVALILAQVVLSYFEAMRSGKVTEQAKVVKEAARKTQNAAATTRRALAAVPPRDQMRALLGPQFDTGAAGKLDAAADDARAAEVESQEAAAKADEATGGTKWDFLGSLAGKAPLAVSGIVLIALGALVMGYVDFSAAAST